MRKRLSLVIPILAAAMGINATAQTAPAWDTSGNTLLNGTYYFRHVFWVVGDYYGDLGEAITIYGTINFNSSTGQYSVSGEYLDTNVSTCGANGCTPQAFTASGSYQVSASGLGFIDTEYSLFAGDEIYGLVSHGVFIGSATETGYPYNDLFVAAPLGTSEPTTSSLNGTYSIVGTDYPAIGEGGNLYGLDYQFTFTANGAGKITAVSPATGYIAGNGGSSTNQSVGQINYSSSNGAFQLQFSGNYANANLIGGGQFLYMSPDGNFVFGGSPDGWNIFVGVRTSGGSQNFSGLYYEAGLDNDVTFLEYGYVAPDSYYGSLVPGSGSYLYHQRVTNVFNGPYDYTSDDPLNAGTAAGTSSDPFNGQFYIVSANGTYRVGFGEDPFLGIEVAIQAPTFSGSGVFLNPAGIEAGSNYALFTAGLAPGEVILINGSGFGSGTPTTLALPTKLGGTQVLIDGIAAPLLYVTPTLIAAQVPFEVVNSGSVVIGIQVVTSSGMSSTVTLFQGDTQPGVWTQNESGLGAAAAYHSSTFQPVTPSNPAVPGETLAVYLNGLGSVTPSIADGQPAPSTTLTNTDFTIAADFLDSNIGYIYPVGVTSVGSASATTEPCAQVSANGLWGDGCPVSFSGLAPTYAGLYQSNFVVPVGDGFGDPITCGPLYLEFQGLDSSATYVESYTSQATVQVGGSCVTDTKAAARSAHRLVHPIPKVRTLHTHPQGRLVPRYR